MKARLHNPYLAEFNRIQRSGDLDRWIKRKDLVHQYSWAVPNLYAIRLIVKYSPLVEVFAGSGYWASLINSLGGDILAFDSKPGAYEFNAEYFDVKKEDERRMAADHSDRTLLMVWPPMDRIVHETFRRYRGGTLIYDGESGGGCTGTDVFFRMLESGWTEEINYKIPQWEGLWDRLYIFKRKK